MTTETRFSEFRYRLYEELGDIAVPYMDGHVEIQANEFTPRRSYRSLQAAIDAFSRYLPVEFVNGCEAV